MLVISGSNETAQKFTFDDTRSNRSTTSQGGSLATRFCLVLSRVMSALHPLSHSDEDIAELNSLITEMNQIDNLTLKHSTVNKICKLLCENKDSIAQKISDSKQPSLTFKSKMKLEMKSHQLDPLVLKMITYAQKSLQELVDARESEMEELMDEQAEAKFKVIQDLKKKINLKIALAQKQGDT